MASRQDRQGSTRSVLLMRIHSIADISLSARLPLPPKGGRTTIAQKSTVTLFSERHAQYCEGWLPEVETALYRAIFSSPYGSLEAGCGLGICGIPPPDVILCAGTLACVAGTYRD